MFLQDRFDRGLQFSTIKSYISALGHFLPLFDGLSLGKHRLVSMFLKGVKRLRPPTRVVVPPWDLSIVLNYLSKPPFEPLASADFKHCLLKTVFLIAVASVARSSELAALDCRPPFTMVRRQYASLKHNEVFRPKVPTPQNVNRTINLQALPDSPSCPVRALNYYLQAAEQVRVRDCFQLFVSFASGNRAGRKVLPSTISGWLVTVIRDAYEDAGLPPPQVSGHTTRKMGTSRAWAAGASCEEICRAATWSSSLTFAQHYKLDVLPASSFSISSLALGEHDISSSSESD